MKVTVGAATAATALVASCWCILTTQALVPVPTFARRGAGTTWRTSSAASVSGKRWPASSSSSAGCGRTTTMMMGRRQKPSLLRMSSDDDGFPSDSSSDSDADYMASAVDVQATEYEPTSAERFLEDLLPSSLSMGMEISDETRAKINEALLKLEALNPTENPALSPLLNGVWSLKYAGGYSPDGALPSPTRQLALFLYSGGYSPGIFALSLAQKLPSQLVDVGELEISIARSNPRVEARVGVKLLGGTESEVIVTANVGAESDIRLREEYQTAQVLGQTVEIPEQLRYARDLYVAYLDEDLLVVRDASGVPEVLVRKEKVFRAEWGSEPEDVDLD